MLNTVDVSEIEKLLVAKGFSIHDRSDQSITIELNIAGHELYIKGKLTEKFPLQLPQFYLLNRHSFSRLAHVSWDSKDNDIGEICGGINISLNINYESPPQVFLHGLNSAIKTITPPLSDSIINDEETQSEFIGHWRFTPSHRSKVDIALIEPDDSICMIKVALKEDKQLYFTKKPLLNTNYLLYPHKNQNSFSSSHRGLYIPFTDIIFPPTPGQTALEWWLNDAISKLSPAKIEDIKKYIRNSMHKVKIFSIIVSIPLGNSKSVWLGLDFKNNKKSSPPLLNSINKSGWEVIPFTPQIHSQEYLLPRGGANEDLSSAHILLVGCGSIGGEIARLLAHSGIGRIDLIDYDTYETNNIYRHTLTPAHIGSKKTEALKLELQNKFPYLDVEVINNYSQLYTLANQEKYLNRYDGIIVATGDPTQERYFNQNLYKFSKRPWVIYTWVEGHCVYVHEDMNGCLSCLYRDPEDSLPSLNNIQNFMKVDQEFTVDIAGCGTHFLPFSHVDAIQSAVLATRMATTALQGKMTESARASWKGPDTTAKDAKLKLTRRYDSFNNSMGYDELAWINCPICGNK